MEDSETDIGWYVSDVHCRRAIGYLSAALVEAGHLRQDFELPILFELWGEALEKTLDVNEQSPIGPNLEPMETVINEGRMRAIACEEASRAFSVFKDNIAGTPQRADGNLNARDFYETLELTEKAIWSKNG